MRRKILILLSVIVAAALIFLLIRNRLVTDPHQRALLESLDHLDFTGMEPQVVSKIEHLRDEVKKNPEAAENWGKLAMNLDAHDLKNESVAIYKEAAILAPSDFRWPYFCAIVLSESAPRESLQLYEHAIQINPNYAPLLVHYGDALFQAGKNPEAQQQYQQAIQKEPNNAHAYFGMAQLAFAQGDMQSSRTNLQKAFELDPSFGDAYNLLASVCRRMQDTKCAAEATEAARNLPEKTLLPDPIYAEVAAEGESSLWHRARGSDYMKQKNYAAAIQEFQKALQIRSDTQTREDLAQALSAGGRFSEAATEYKNVIAQHPTARNYFGLAMVYARSGSYDQAAEFFQKAVQQKSDFPEAYFNLAVAYAKMGRLPETIETLKEAIRVKPDYTEAHYHLALAYLAAKNPSEATKEMNTVMRLDANVGKRLQALIAQSKASNISTK